MKVNCLNSFILISLFCCCSCKQQEKIAQVPNYLKGQTIEFHYTSTSGIFKNLQGHTRDTVFEDASIYKSKLRSGIVRSYGHYIYSLFNDRIATLILRTDSPMSHGNELELELYFLTPNSGDFKGNLVNGIDGYVEGTFVISS